MVRWHLILSGRVQGVGLRFRTKIAAQRFHLTGWVHNLDNGDVELELQGEQDNIDNCLLYLRSLPGIQFSILQAEEKEPAAESRFRVT